MKFVLVRPRPIFGRRFEEAPMAQFHCQPGATRQDRWNLQISSALKARFMHFIHGLKIRTELSRAFSARICSPIIVLGLRPQAAVKVAPLAH